MNEEEQQAMLEYVQSLYADDSAAVEKLPEDQKAIFAKMRLAQDEARAMAQKAEELSRQIGGLQDGIKNRQGRVDALAEMLWEMEKKRLQPPEDEPEPEVAEPEPAAEKQTELPKKKKKPEPKPEPKPELKVATGD